MAEILRPNFGRKGPSSQTVETAEIPASRSDEAMVDVLKADLIFLKGNLETIKQALARTDEITDFIFSIADFNKNDANIDIRREALQVTSLEQFCSYLLKTGKMDWKAKPSFYGAVILEMDVRLKLLGEIKKGLEKLNYSK